MSGLVRGLQERAARAFPAAVVANLDGWWLRHADSGAWWSGTVLPHGDPPDLAGAIRSAEDFYAAHDAPARFQVSPGACPAALDDALAGRGYRLDSPMSLRSAPTARVLGRPSGDGPRVHIDDEPTDAWFDTWRDVHGAGPERDMLGRVDRPSGYATVTTGAGAVAVGRAVADTGWAGVFGMATRPEARGRGLAGRVLAALAGWAADRGCGRMYLQVACDNTAGRRLYDRAGFTEVCRYHYRSLTGRR